MIVDVTQMPEFRKHMAQVWSDEKWQQKQPEKAKAPFPVFLAIFRPNP